MLKAAATSGTIALAALALGQVQHQIERAISRKIPDNLFDIVIIVALILLATTIVLWLLSFLPITDIETLYVSDTPKPSDIPALRELAVSFFGESFATEEKLKEWKQRCNECITVVYKAKQYKLKSIRTMKGFFIVLPLTEKAVTLYKKNEITGALFLQEHIPKDIKSTYGVYIAGIAATDARAKAISLTLLHRILENYRKAGIKTVLARPTTNRGIELAEYYEMKPVPMNIINGYHLYERMPL